MIRRRIMGLFLALPLLGAAGLSTGDASANGYSQQLAVSGCDVSLGTGSFAWDGIYNASTSASMTLDCGIPKTNTTNIVDVVTAWVNDQNSSSITCALRVMDGSGTALYTGATKTSFGTGRQALAWTSIGGIDGYPYVSCTVPKATSSSSTTRSGLAGLYLTDL
jgi:hypothetical protein